MFGLKTNTSIKMTLINGTAIAALLLIASPAIAQVENATEIADPSRASQDLLNIDELPQLSEKIKVDAAAMQNAPAGAENIKFKLDRLEINGVTTYNAEDINPLYNDKLGTVVSLSDIYAIANSLTNKYRNEGYILTQVVVPPQEIENGLVKLRVVEGYIDQITVQGDIKEPAREQIQSYAENMQEGGVLNSKKLEKYLLLINDLPGITARSVLSPSKTQTGASDLTIIVEREKYEAEISFNNHGSRYLGPYQLSFNNSINSLFGYNDRISGQFVISGDQNRINELLFGSIVYDQAILNYGTKLRFIGSVTSTEPGDDLDEFDVKGNSRFLSASVSHPFIRSRTTNLSARATFDFRNLTSTNDIEPKREDKIRSLRLGTTLQFMDNIFGVGVNAIDLELSHGLEMFGASYKGQSNLTRASGNPEYTKLNLQFQRLQRIVPKLNLLVAGQGQWASGPLLSSEEFGVGGTNIGRGYDSSEIVGDDGIAGKLELQWNQPKQIRYLDSYQLFTYVDAGRIWDQDATTSANKRESIASTGVGVRADLNETTKAGLGIALPLTKDRDTSDDKDPRYYFNITHTF